MRRIWIGLILFYQRWISPYKGFRCAHGRLHKGLTCSEAVKRIIQEDGLWQGRQRIRRRFRECRYAYYVLRSRPQWSFGGPLLMVAPDSSDEPLKPLKPPKPPVRPEFDGSHSPGPAAPTAPTKADEFEQEEPEKPKSYFKRRGSGADECGDCLCFPLAVPCDIGGADCDACPCDLPF